MPELFFQVGSGSVSSDLSDKAVHTLAGDLDRALILDFSAVGDHTFSGEGRFIENVDMGLTLSFLESPIRDERDMGESSWFPIPLDFFFVSTRLPPPRP